MMRLSDHDPTASLSDARLMSVLETAVDGIVVIDEHARILVFNRACEVLFGYDSADVLGQNIKMIMPMDYAQHHDAYIGNYITSGVKKIIGIGREVRGKHSDGTVFPLELSVGEAHTPQGRQFIGILRDLRPRKEAEQRLNQLQAELVHLARVSAMDEMGAAMAHELNQPLTALTLYLQAVTRSLQQTSAMPQGAGTMAQIPTPVFEILEKSLREAERAGGIIRSMRHFIEKREPERKLADVHGLVDDAVELTLLGHKNAPQLLRDYSPHIGKVCVDAVQIQQIIVNLLRNALQAVQASAAPMIRIRTWQEADHCCISVEDNGEGLDAQALAGLFKAFSTSKRTGLGLGLAISRSIAQNHGGDLVASSQGRGLGARFVLHLPQPSGADETRKSDRQNMEKDKEE